MPITVPPAVNYPGPLIYLRSQLFNPPPEGNRMIPVEIDWGEMGGANNCVAFNLSQLGPLDFTQIVALSVDNSECGADIQIVFTDSAQTYSVPAYAPSTTFEVFTNSLSFFVLAEYGEESVDITRMAILNYLPPPFAIPATREQNNVTGANINITGAGSTQVIPTGTTGTLEAMTIQATIVTASAAGASTCYLQDGTGKLCGVATIASSTGMSQSTLILNLPECNIRFSNGLSLYQTGGWTPSAASFFTYNILYRSP